MKEGFRVISDVALVKVFMEVAIMVILLMAVVLWGQIEGMTRTEGRNMRLTVAALAVAHLMHSVEIMMPAHPEWLETGMLMGFFVAGAFWISATFDIAEGRL